MAETVTNRGLFHLFDSGWENKDLRMAVFLGTQTGAHNKDHNFVSDLDAVSGISIHAERIALTGETASEDDTNDRAALDTGDAVFAAAPGVTAQGVCVYIEGASDAAREILTIHTTNFPQPMDGGLTVGITDIARATSP